MTRFKTTFARAKDKWFNEQSDKKKLSCLPLICTKQIKTGTYLRPCHLSMIVFFAKILYNTIFAKSSIKSATQILWLWKASTKYFSRNKYITLKHLLSTKRSNTRYKSCSISCKIFNVCLTILWALGLKLFGNQIVLISCKKFDKNCRWI